MQENTRATFLVTVLRELDDESFPVQRNDAHVLGGNFFRQTGAIDNLAVFGRIDIIDAEGFSSGQTHVICSCILAKAERAPKPIDAHWGSFIPLALA